MAQDFSYWSHVIRAQLSGFTPLTRKQFIEVASKAVS